MVICHDVTVMDASAPPSITRFFASRARAHTKESRVASVVAGIFHRQNDNTMDFIKDLSIDSIRNAAEDA